VKNRVKIQVEMENGKVGEIQTSGVTATAHTDALWDDYAVKGPEAGPEMILDRDTCHKLAPAGDNKILAELWASVGNNHYLPTTKSLAFKENILLFALFSRLLDLSSG